MYRLYKIFSGRPSLFFVLRTPYHAAYTLLAQLYARPAEFDPASSDTSGDDKENGHLQNGVKNSMESKNTVRFFQIPPEFEKPLCKLYVWIIGTHRP